ncbi:MAG: hypothetical protein NC548_24405 [Lachnospiraceae bacterium]|nr:hypothetical protein [Lachnospiraceae bacterium]
MAKRKKIIMSWSECRVEVGYTGEGDAFATELVSVGTINDKSTTLATADGETLEAKASGGKTVAREEGEPVVTITTRVKEMDFDTEGFFTGAVKSSDGDELEVSTNIVQKEMSVKVTPKNIGAIGVKAPRCSVTFRPGSSEDEGHYVDLTFTILEPESGKLYKKFRVKKEDWADPKFAGDTASD